MNKTTPILTITSDDLKNLTELCDLLRAARNAAERNLQTRQLQLEYAENLIKNIKKRNGRKSSIT